MARPLRIEYEGAFYHITSRGNEKKPIFLNDRDYFHFLDLLERVNERYNILIHAYVLMANHYHLLVETPQGKLVSTLHDLNTAYTNYFNKKHDRVGHLFQGRYRSILVEKDSYLLELSRYIHLNPVRAGLVERPEVYRWSSYKSYLSSKPIPTWLCTEGVLGQMGKELAHARFKYRKFVEGRLKNKDQNPFQKLAAGMVLGGENFLDGVIERIKTMEVRTEIPIFREVHLKKDVQSIAEGVASFYKVSLQTIREMRRPAHLGSQVAMYFARKKTDLSLGEIGKYFGERHYTAVSTAFRRVAQRRKKDERFDKQLEKIEERLVGKQLMSHVKT